MVDKFSDVSGIYSDSWSDGDYDSKDLLIRRRQNKIVPPLWDYSESNSLDDDNNDYSENNSSNDNDVQNMGRTHGLKADIRTFYGKPRGKTIALIWQTFE